MVGGAKVAQESRQVIGRHCAARSGETFIAVNVAHIQEQFDSDSVFGADLADGLFPEADGDAEARQKQQQVVVLEQYVREFHCSRERVM